METKYKTKYLSKEQKQHLRQRIIQPHDYISNSLVNAFLDGEVKRIKFGNWRTKK